MIAKSCLWYSLDEARNQGWHMGASPHAKFFSPPEKMSWT